jgi:hypothetical protein
MEMKVELTEADIKEAIIAHIKKAFNKTPSIITFSSYEGGYGSRTTVTAVAQFDEKSSDDGWGR